MNQSKKIFNVVIVVLLSALIVVATVFAISFLSRPPTTKNNINLGNKYLANLEYDKAVTAYQSALAFEPTNKEAINGLAKAYKETNQTELALEIISGSKTKYIDPLAEDLRLDIYIENGNLEKAVVLADRIASQTDDAEMYKTCDEILTRLLSRPVVYGASDMHNAYIEGGKLFTNGKNFAGQLGTFNGLNDMEFVTATAEDALFPDSVQSVFCTAFNTFGLTAAGDVFSAGSNKTAVMGTNSYDFQTLAGWKKLDALPGIARITGDSISAAYVNLSGEVFVTGQFADTACKTPTKITSLGKIMHIANVNNIYYMLSTQGNLWYAHNSPGENGNGHWAKAAGNVVMFSVDKDTKAISYLTFDNKICISNHVEFTLPFEKIGEKAFDATYDPGFDVKAMVATSKSLLLLKSDNTLIQYKGSGENVIANPDNKIVQQLYLYENIATAQFEDGSYLNVDLAN